MTFLKYLSRFEGLIELILNALTETLCDVYLFETKNKLRFKEKKT